MRIGVWLGAIGATILLLWAEGAQAQTPRGVQWTPTRSARLISKDVGGERWAIRVDENDGTIVGNVFRTDGGPPQFVWCWPQSTADDPVRLRCRGTTGCDPWVDLGEVEIPGSFLAPPSSCEADAVASVPPSPGRPTAESASTLRISPDEQRTLISKDVNGLRWSIVYEPSNFVHTSVDRHFGRITGNVFDPGGGPPRFVACNAKNGASNENLFECFGADACGCEPCDGSDWTQLPDVVLPRSFIEGRRCPAADAPPSGFEASLLPSDEDDAERFGYVTAFDGTTAVVSVPDEALYFYEQTDAGWTETQRIAATPSSGNSELARFGGSILLAGSTLLVSFRDEVRIYERGGAGWASAGSFTPEARSRVNLSAIAPSLLAVTTHPEDEPETLRVLEGSGRSWSETAAIELPGEFTYENFGRIALTPDTLAVAVAGRYATGASYSTTVFLYERQGGSWTLTRRIDDPRFDVNEFGIAMALEGDTLVIGSPPPITARSQRAHDGAVHVWQRGASGWSEAAVLRTCGPDLGRFGAGVDLSGDLLAVGSAGYRDRGSAGDVYLFERTGEGWRERGRFGFASEASLSRSQPLHLSSSRLAVPREGQVDMFDLAVAELEAPETCPEPAPEQWPTDGWQVEDPVAHGMNPVLLERALEYAALPGKNTQAVVVVRHGAIVAEWYADGRDASSYAASWSTAKSISSAVIGIALDRGVFPSVDVSLSEYFPEWRGNAHAAITLRHALTMTSGLDWTEDYSVDQTRLSDIANLAAVVRDDLAYVLAKPMLTTPGTYWFYSSADTMMLSGALQAATGRTLGDYAREVLFDPIGMTSAQWWTDAVGSTLSWCCVDAPSREIARFGLLYARGGHWEDRQVVPASWVRDSGRSVVLVDEENGYEEPGYGYQWWLGLRDAYRYSADAFEARGYDGQYIEVFPSLDLVIVRHGLYEKDPGPPIADPNLFAVYPAAGLGNGKGTVPPDSWDGRLFTGSIVRSIVD